MLISVVTDDNSQESTNSTTRARFHGPHRSHNGAKTFSVRIPHQSARYYTNGNSMEMDRLSVQLSLEGYIKCTLMRMSLTVLVCVGSVSC